MITTADKCWGKAHGAGLKMQGARIKVHRTRIKHKRIVNSNE
jgi:hypothetical protein